MKKTLLMAKALNAYIRCLQLMLRPIAGFCLRHSMRIRDIVEATKVALIDSAADEMEKRGEKVNVSRLSAMTGLHRRDVMRIYQRGEVVEEQRGLVSKVIGQWQQDPRFVTKKGTPRTLSQEEFQDLIFSVSGDLHPGTVLFELQRIEAVEETSRGLRLLASAYVPKGNIVDGFELLSEDAQHLISAVEENIFNPEEVPNLHGRTEYDNIRADAIPKIREWLVDEGSAFHKRARSFLAKYDQDVNPKQSDKSGVQVVLGTFSKVNQDSFSEGKE